MITAVFGCFLVIFWCFSGVLGRFCFGIWCMGNGEV